MKDLDIENYTLSRIPRPEEQDPDPTAFGKKKK